MGNGREKPWFERLKGNHCEVDVEAVRTKRTLNAMKYA